MEKANSDIKGEWVKLNICDCDAIMISWKKLTTHECSINC